ncbi:MAG: response regulator [Anaerolineae bacterium]|nr:response regulator [Anaerolineae bacterium]
MKTQIPIFVMSLRFEEDIVKARSLARTIAGRLGFDTQDQVRIATAVSEIVRVIFGVLKRGEVAFLLKNQGSSQTFLITINDKSNGHSNLQTVFAEPLAPEVSAGVTSARRLVDRLTVEFPPREGTVLSLEKTLTGPFVTPPQIASLVADLAQRTPQTALEEIRQQNEELTNILEDLHQRQIQLSQLNQELSETNQGVMALYAELEEQAQQLRAANAQKSRYLSIMSHEIRTPLSSIVALARILLDRLDGDLTSEQEQQVRLIQSSAQELLDMVANILDLAKLEKGKLEINPTVFELSQLIGGLRGIFKPLFTNPDVALLFDEPVDFPIFFTDQKKVAQILRNLISNAHKFTESGEVRVSVKLDQTGTQAIFSVTDTGIGISAEDQELLFQEYTQLHTHLHKQTTGTGLGLSISKQLAELLGGSLSVQSVVKKGSTFTLTIPLVYPNVLPPALNDADLSQPKNMRLPLLVIEDEAEDIEYYKRIFDNTEFEVVAVQSFKQAWQILASIQPVAIILDLLMPEESGLEFLAELKSNETTWDIPVVVATVFEGGKKAAALLGAQEYAIKPLSKEWLLKKLRQIGVKQTILLIDNDEVARYTFKKSVGKYYTIVEAADGAEGLQQARELVPEVIFLDLVMPGMSGFEVLDALKSDQKTQNIPVIIYSSKELNPEEHYQLRASAEAILSKSVVSSDTLLGLIRGLLAKGQT